MYGFCFKYVYCAVEPILPHFHNTKCFKSSKWCQTKKLKKLIILGVSLLRILKYRNSGNHVNDGYFLYMF